MTNPTIGDAVDFKMDMEQQGRIVAIKAGTVTVEYEAQGYDDEEDDFMDTNTIDFKVSDLRKEDGYWFAKSF